ncbi:hypothetical protein D3C86_647550 [compost metagenome]
MDEQRLGGIAPAKLTKQLVTRPPVLVPCVDDQLGQYAGNLRCLSRLFGVQLVRLDEVRRSSAHHTEALQEPFEVTITKASFPAQEIDQSAPFRHEPIR